MLNELGYQYSAIDEPRLHDAVRALPLQWDPREGVERVTGGDCCCKGTKRFTMAELQMHGRDMSRQGGSRGLVHAALSTFLISEGFGTETRVARPQLQPMAAIEMVSWPPMLLLRARPEYELLINSKASAARYLGSVSKAMGYTPIYGASDRASDTSRFLGMIVLTFHAPSKPEQDGLLDAAVALKEEVDAQVRQAAGSNIFASASFVDKACFDGLPASARKELGKCTGCEHFEWRKLADERQRIRIDAESRSQVCPV